MRFNIQFNAGQSRKAIRDASAALADPTPMYQEIAEYAVEAHRQRFIKGVGPDGTPWAPKSQSTLDRYKQLGYGALTRPLIGPSRRLSREILQFVSRDGVVIGWSLKYAGVMHSGAARGAFGSDSRGRPVPWGGIPARPIVGLSQKDDRALVEIAEDYLRSRLDPEA